MKTVSISRLLDHRMHSALLVVLGTLVLAPVTATSTPERAATPATAQSNPNRSPLSRWVEHSIRLAGLLGEQYAGAGTLDDLVQSLSYELMFARNGTIVASAAVPRSSKVNAGQQLPGSRQTTKERPSPRSIDPLESLDDPLSEFPMDDPAWLVGSGFLPVSLFLVATGLAGVVDRSGRGRRTRRLAEIA